jgi:hypothetical protein
MIPLHLAEFITGFLVKIVSHNNQGNPQPNPYFVISVIFDDNAKYDG